MEVESRFRHEYKFNINYADYLALRSCLMPIMQRDMHTNANGQYLIRSIYFDNYKDKALQEKLSGIAKREKFRIRYYNDDLTFLTLEKKMKINNLCRKISAPLTEEECQCLLSGNRQWMLCNQNELVREFYYKIESMQLRPRVLVSYVREPYLYSAGNVRITFDMNIRSTLFHNRFPEAVPTDINVCDVPGQIILEIKYDDFFPSLLSDLLKKGGFRQEAYSKYASCRRFG